MICSKSYTLTDRPCQCRHLIVGLLKYRVNSMILCLFACTRLCTHQTGGTSPTVFPVSSLD